MSRPTVDLTPFVQSCEAIVERHRLDRPGAYRRYPAGDGRETTLPDPYGCADAVNILATIGRLPRDPRIRSDQVATLQALQNPEDGLFREATHAPVHCTAHCLGALHLLDATPLHPLRALHEQLDHRALGTYLEGLDWREQPWNAAHKGAGVYAALVLAGEADAAWEESYFAWLQRHFDPDTGCLRRGAVAPVFHRGSGTTSLMPHLAGTFHYLFNMEYARRALPHPAALVDSCLRLWEDGSYPLGEAVGFAEIDWVFCLSRARQQCDHRWQEAQDALEAFADRFTAYLLGLDASSHPGLNDLHRLFGSLCALAELQRVLPERIRGVRPLQLVLDRRPFI